MSHSPSRREITKRLFVLALAYFIFAIYCDGYDDERSSRYLSEKTVPLEFVHISHTGGVEIETLAANQANLNWGACHWRTIEEENCMDPDQEWYTSPDVNTKNYALHNIWHTPPKDLMSVIEPKQNPYTDKDLFTIVRNPYAKIISEFYCPWNGYSKSDKNEAATLNAWVMDKLKAFSDQSVQYKKFLKDHSQQSNGTVLTSDNVSKVYEKHFTSQFEYVYGNEGERIIQNVLHFEDIKSEFKSLMKKYDLTIKLPLQIQESSGKLSHLDLYPETIAQINDIFRPDFEAFGYEMVETFDGRAYSLRSLSKPCMQYKVGDSECKRDEGITVDTKKFNAPIGLPHATTFFMGIQTELTEKGANDRDRIRKTYLSINDARLCSWEEYKNQHDSSGGRIVPCRVPYAFIVGGIPDVPLEQGGDKPVSINRSLLEGEKDVLVLDIKNDIKAEREKVFAFFKWASSIGSEYHLDFVASVQTGTLIDMQGLFSFIDLELPPSPLSRRMYGGEVYGHLGGYYATDPLYFMSIDLVHFVGNKNVKHLNTHSKTPGLDIGKLITYHQKPIKFINMNPNLFWFTDLDDQNSWEIHWKEHMKKLPRKKPFIETMQICEDFTENKLP